MLRNLKTPTFKIHKYFLLLSTLTPYLFLKVVMMLDKCMVCDGVASSDLKVSIIIMITGITFINIVT